MSGGFLLSRCREGSGAAELPVDDSVLVEEHEGGRDLCSIEPGTRLVELSGALNLEHEVSAVYVLHDEKEAVLKGEEKTPFSSFHCGCPHRAASGEPIMIEPGRHGEAGARRLDPGSTHAIQREDECIPRASEGLGCYRKTSFLVLLSWAFAWSSGRSPKLASRRLGFLSDFCHSLAVWPWTGPEAPATLTCVAG